MINKKNIILKIIDFNLFYYFIINIYLFFWHPKQN